MASSSSKKKKKKVLIGPAKSTSPSQCITRSASRDEENASLKPRISPRRSSSKDEADVKTTSNKDPSKTKIRILTKQPGVTLPTQEQRSKKKTKVQEIFSRKGQVLNPEQRSKLIKEHAAEKKYGYLLDPSRWGKDLLTTSNAYTAKDLHGKTAFCLHDLSDLGTVAAFCNDPKKFSETQKDPSKAKEQIYGLLNILPDDELREQLKAIDDKDLCTKFAMYQAKTREIADMEVAMHNYKNIVGVCWVPRFSKQPLEQDENNRLIGHYVCKVKKSEGVFRNMIPASNWLEREFGESVLATVQKVAIQSLEKQAVQEDDADATRFETGFVNVEAHDKKVMLEEDEINMLKWVPDKEVPYGPYFEQEEVTTAEGEKKLVYKKDFNGKKIPIKEQPTKLVPAHWVGYSKATKKVHDLTEEFVNGNNFLPGFLKQLQHLGNAKKDNNKFISVPPGAPRLHEQVPAHLQTGVFIRFQ